MNTENQSTGQAIAAESKAEEVPQKLEITKDISDNLNETGKWGNFIAIVGFIFLGFMVLAGFVITIALTIIPTEGSEFFPFPPFLIGIFYLLMGAVYFFPLLYLFRFSSGIRKALSLKNQNQFKKAIYNLRKHYRFIGILMIVFMALYVLILIVMVIAGVFTGISALGSGLAA